MRIIATSIWCVLFTLPLFAQREVIISSNPKLEAHYQQQYEKEIPAAAFAIGLEKNDCTVPAEDFIPITSGDTYVGIIDIDTVGFGPDGVFTCLNCNSLMFGTVSISNDTITYVSNAGLLAETEIPVAIAYCDEDGNNCNGETQDFNFLIRRAGSSTSPATIAVGPGEATQIAAPNDLPGALRCSFFIDCPDNYEGRDQLAYLTDYSAPTNEFVYKASRFDGTNEVCLVLCDEFGICDTTFYTFEVNVASITPPVYDDFSYDGPVPTTDFWLDQEVYVNTELAIDPPSIGVATFDGIDNRGRPYGGGYGPSDRLTSTYLNTSSGNWVLSFYLQRGGLSDRPETRDSLVLQFRNDDDNWVTVREFLGIPANQPLFELDTFNFYSATIAEPYQHDRFQFRFINYGDSNGFRDAWHLDYVRLDNNPSNSEVFNDIAFTRPPDFMLQTYTSLPWRHFEPQLEALLSEDIDVGVYNHFATAQNASPSTILLEEQQTGINAFGTTPTLFNGLEVNLDNGTPINRTYSLMGDATGSSDVWDDYLATLADPLFDAEDELAFRLTYSLQNTSQDGAAFVSENDQVSRTTHFSNYFAYDDGSAESTIEASSGQQVVVKYEAAVADTITGVRFHFPHTAADISSQEMYINIWLGELDDTAEYRVRYQPLYASTFFDTIQGFTSYELLDDFGEVAHLAVPAGDFYVGWEQVSVCQFGQCIAVGYDRNRPSGVNNIFVNPGGDWEPISGVTSGSLMIRPVMSGGEPVGTTSTSEVPKAEALKIYPNPSRDLIYLQGPDWANNAQVEVFSNTGQVLLRQAYTETINISNLPAGMYYVRLHDAQGNYTTPERLIVIK